MPSIRFVLLAAATLAAAASAADANILITVDKSAQQMTVDIDGVQRWQWPVSTGRRGYATPSGTFKAFRMEKDHFSREWDDAPMPNSIFFTKKGHAIHGSFETKRLGRAVSHGCVRLAPANAARLYALVAQRGVTSAIVVVSDGDGARPAPGPLQQQQQQQVEPAPGYKSPGFWRPAPQPYGPPVFAPRPYDPYRQNDNWRW